MNSEAYLKIRQVFIDFRTKIDSIRNQKKSLLKEYRSKLEEAKIEELKKSIKS